ncbi:MAG: hypothetical protein Q8M16_24670, partial [Pirellulaceae bacterium]|nr:hypothetical protein [Pirellulaceae bacterium]
EVKKLSIGDDGTFSLGRRSPTGRTRAAVNLAVGSVFWCQAGIRQIDSGHAVNHLLFAWLSSIAAALSAAVSAGVPIDE